MSRHKNANLDIPDAVETQDQVNTAILLEIRDELQALNSKLNCWRIQRMFRTIERLDKRAARKNPLRGKLA